MLLDELAAATMKLEIGDPAGLRHIHALLERLPAEAGGRENPAAAQAREIVERMLEQRESNPAQAVEALRRLVGELQSGDAADEGEETRKFFESDPEIFEGYITESLEHLQKAESALLILETAPEDQENLNSIFRAFHSIKGTSSFLGFNRIKALAHEAEKLLERARAGEILLTGGYADLTLEAADHLKRMIRQLKEHPESQGVWDPEAFASMLDKVSNPDSAAALPPAQASPALPAGRSANAAAPPADRMPLKKSDETAPADKGSATVRVSTEKLDHLINMIGELVITQAMVTRREELKKEEKLTWFRSLAQMEKITRELQDVSMSLRMVPLKSVFQRMERLVRDLAKKSGKIVRFHMEGEQTEIDRNMVEILSDPLVHLLRNAVDHGIETPEQRQAAGKPETGTVSLVAYHAAGNVVVEVRDDGRGLERQRILDKALEKQLTPPGRELTESEIFSLIFLPGFSTAEKVTDISGRGVGLDVVKRNIDELRGRVNTSTRAGQETVFTLQIPLTLAIIDGMLLQVGDRQYILPTVSVQKALRPAQDSLFTVQGQGEMVKLREHLIPIFRLHRLFNISGAAEDPTRGLLLAVEHEHKSFALLADALLGQQQVVVKSLPEGLQTTKGVSGAAILSDGRIGLILDLPGILRLARKQQDLSEIGIR